MAGTVRSDVLTLLQTGINGAFIGALNGAPETYKELCTYMQTNNDTETFGWLGVVPGVREWVGERETKAIGEEKYTLAPKLWENSIEIPRTLIEDEKLGQLTFAASALGAKAGKGKNDRVSDIIKEATTALCYDGTAFFNATHKYTSKGSYKTAQSNLTNLALDATNLKTVITAMSKVKDSDGKVMGIRPDTLLVPPDLEFTAYALLNSFYNPGTGDNSGMGVNPLQGKLKVIVDYNLTDEDAWYVLCLNEFIRPFIFIDRVGIELASLEEQSEQAYKTDKYNYGSRARYEAGYGLWQLAYASIPAG